jgi:ankyrin repeat protein
MSVTKKGYTPLAVAISKSNKDVAKYLIEQGAKVNCFDPTYGSILHLAIRKGDLDLVKLLLKSGADPEMVDTDYGESLVYTSTSSDGIKALIEAGEDMLGNDTFGRLPICPSTLQRQTQTLAVFIISSMNAMKHTPNS